MSSSSSRSPSGHDGPDLEAPLARTARQHGRPLQPTANKPLPLDRQDRCWYVAAGCVDVFALPSSGSTADRRTHLVTCVSGDVLFGLDAASLRTELALVAVGRPGVELWSVPTGVLDSEDLSHPELADALGRWIGGLTRTVVGMVMVRPDIAGRIGPGDAHPIAGGTRVRGHGNDVVWLQDVSGALFLDIADTGDAAIPFPLHTDAWALLPADVDRVSGLDTPAVLSASTWQRGLAQFHAALLESATTNIALALVDDFNRLAQRERLDAARMETALRGSVAPEGSADAAAGTPTDQDPLVEAMSALARELSAERPVLASGERDLPVAERLRRLAVSARVGLRDIKLPRKWWRQNGQPFVGWTARGAPRAFRADGRNGYQVFDPEAADWRRVDGRVAGDIKPDATAVYGGLTAPRVSVRELLRFALRGGSRDAWALVLFGLAATAPALVAPFAAAALVETAIPFAEHALMWQLLLVLCATGLAGGIFHLLQAIASVRLQSLMDVQGQSAVIYRLLRLPIAFFRRNKAGTLTYHALGVSLIRRLLARGVVVGVLGGVFALANLAVMLWFSPTLTLTAAMVAGAAAGFVVVANLLRLRALQHATRIDGDTAGIALQIVFAMAKIRIAGAERRAFALWMGSHAQHRYWMYRAGLAASAVVTLTATLPLAASLLFFNLAALDPSLTPAGFVAFLTAVSAFLIGFVRLTDELSAAVAVSIAFERLKPILDAAPETPRAFRPLSALAGHVEMNRVSFRYRPDAAPVLRDVSFRVEPGQFIAIAGPSGSGKSTLMRLMLGFEKPESGSIYYDGQDVSRLDVQELRRQFGVVLQNGKVYPGTIFDNIVANGPYGHDEAWEAAELAGIAADIRAMPMGMFTFLTDGSTISGGQRQRLLLARAVIGKPKILLLDEATSALDNRTQAAVASNIEQLNLTRIVIAHRLTTIERADHIYVLDEGRIVEEGRYEDLVAASGLFAAMAARQTL